MESILDSGNRLFALARRGRRQPHLVLAILLGLVFPIVGGLLGAVLFVLTVGPIRPMVAGDAASPLAAAAAQTGQLVFGFLPIAILIWAWLAWYERRPFWTLGFERPAAGRRYLGGLLLGLVMFGAAVGVMALLGFVAPESQNPAQEGLAAAGGVALVYLGWTVQGPVEEILTRGWLMPTVGARYGPWVGVAVSALIFAVLHGLNPNISAVALLNLVLVGLFLSLYALWEGGLWGVCAWHAGWNWVQGNILGFEVSGTQPAGGMLFNLREAGPGLVTGDEFGPEGGLAVTLVLVVGTIILALLLWRQPRAGVAASA